ncbi:hypothetical protein WL00_28980 [Burkholderia cepacia]|nr:hypothetical protein WL00_28980 [Burkholderia cepacia]KVX54658.1 hypothetical protein WL06_13160 [Burkholderia cepacia]
MLGNMSSEMPRTIYCSIVQNLLRRPWCVNALTRIKLSRLRLRMLLGKCLSRARMESEPSFQGQQPTANRSWNLDESWTLRIACV